MKIAVNCAWRYRIHVFQMNYSLLCVVILIRGSPSFLILLDSSLICNTSHSHCLSQQTSPFILQIHPNDPPTHPPTLRVLSPALCARPASLALRHARVRKADNCMHLNLVEYFKSHFAVSTSAILFRFVSQRNL
jgi:hypothetical protein